MVRTTRWFNGRLPRAAWSRLRAGYHGVVAGIRGARARRRQLPATHPGGFVSRVERQAYLAQIERTRNLTPGEWP